MQAIPIDQLRSLWEQQGIWGDWRRLLKCGYQPEELYFEFGLVPEKDRRHGDFRIVLDHATYVRLCPSNLGLWGDYVVRPDDLKAGSEEIDAARKYHTLFVTNADYRVMLAEAAQIYKEYGDENIGCFWSIPNKWFSEFRLIRFLTEKIVLSEDYRGRTRTRQDWYWP